jgi:hypothetical protein
LTLMHTKAETTDHSGYTDTHSGFVIPSPRIKGERIRIYGFPFTRLRHSDFACHARLLAKTFGVASSEGGSFFIRDIRAGSVVLPLFYSCRLV